MVTETIELFGGQQTVNQGACYKHIVQTSIPIQNYGNYKLFFNSQLIRFTINPHFCCGQEASVQSKGT